MLNVLHYVGAFSYLPETFIYDLLLRLKSCAKQSHKVLCHNRINERDRPFPGVLVAPFKRSILEKVQFRLIGENWRPLASTACKAIIAETKPDLIHAHFGPNGIRMARLLMEMRSLVPILIHCHGTDILSLPFKDRCYRKNLKDVAKRANTIFVANTRFLLTSMIELGIPEEMIRIVNYSVNDEFLATEENNRHVYSRCKDALRILAVGRLIRWKGHRFLIEGFADFLKKEASTDAMLTIVGEGPERKNLESLIDQLDLKEKVTLRGAQSHSDVAKLLVEHDLLIQPSIIDPDTRQCESFGMTILEAIAKGLPVVVTRTGGMPELIGQESPWSQIIEPASASAISGTISEFATIHPSLSNNREYAASRLAYFSAEKQMNSLQRIYQEATSVS